MLYPVIVVPGRVNGGFHEVMILLELSLKREKTSPTGDKGPMYKHEKKVGT